MYDHALFFPVAFSLQPKHLSSYKKVLFICVENSCRSQIAEAFARIHGKGVVDAYSCGSRPSGRVNEKAIDSMKEIGYDLSNHQSKSFTDIPDVEYDMVVTMGCGDECPAVRARARQDWDIPDPASFDEGQFREIRALVGSQVVDLINRIKRS